jgi:hypothetical protein
MPPDLMKQFRSEFFRKATGEWRCYFVTTPEDRTIHFIVPSVSNQPRRGRDD